MIVWAFRLAKERGRDELVLQFAGEDVSKDRVALLLKHFSQPSDDREPWRVMYPLSEVLQLLTRAAICSRDDFDEIVAWGEARLDSLRRFSALCFGVPGQRRLRRLVNRVDPTLFGRRFERWIAALWPDRRGLIAIEHGDRAPLRPQPPPRR